MLYLFFFGRFLLTHLFRRQSEIRLGGDRYRVWTGYEIYQEINYVRSNLW